MGTRHQRRYARLRAAGLCLHCAQPARQGRATCGACNDKRRQRRSGLWARAVERVANARFRAKKLGVPYDLSPEWYIAKWNEQGGRCAVSGILLDLSPWYGKGQNPKAPSLDRIVAGGGYTRDNVRIVSVFWNTAMNNWGEDFVRELLGSFHAATPAA